MDTDRPSPDDIKAMGKHDHEIAFEVWALLAGQSAPRTVEILAEHYDIHTSTNSIHVWKTRHGWKLKTRELLAAVAPDRMEAAALNLVGGVGEAAFYLVQAAAGQVEANRDRINAATAVLDRVGFLPHTRREAVKTGVNSVGASAELPELTMSDDALEEALRSIGRIRETVTVEDQR